MKNKNQNTSNSKSIKDSVNKLLRALGENTAEEIPKGWLTVEEISKAHGKSMWWAKNTMKKLVENKLVETKKVRVMVGSGNCLVRIYKI
jgi:hypothetical protein